MQIPGKINPDRIRDSIIQIFFKADIPFEPLIGFCYMALEKSGWKYTNRQSLTDPQKGLVIELAPASQHFFVKDRVRLQLFPNQSIAFNCISKYVGWKEYGVCIQSVIKKLTFTGHFSEFTRIGIRYISEFANINILEKVKFTAMLYVTLKKHPAHIQSPMTLPPDPTLFLAFRHLRNKAHIARHKANPDSYRDKELKMPTHSPPTPADEYL